VLYESWQRQRSSAAPEPRIGEFAEAGHSPKQDTAKYGAGEQFVLPPHLFRIEAFPFDWILPFQAIYLKKKKKSLQKRFLGKVRLPAFYGTHPMKFPKSIVGESLDPFPSSHCFLGHPQLGSGQEEQEKLPRAAGSYSRPVRDQHSMSSPLLSSVLFLRSPQ
jgi:hypothetical protein